MTSVDGKFQIYNLVTVVKLMSNSRLPVEIPSQQISCEPRTQWTRTTQHQRQNVFVPASEHHQTQTKYFQIFLSTHWSRFCFERSHTNENVPMFNRSPMNRWRSCGCSTIKTHTYSKRTLIALHFHNIVAGFCKQKAGMKTLAPCFLQLVAIHRRVYTSILSTREFQYETH